MDPIKMITPRVAPIEMPIFAPSLGPPPLLAWFNDGDTNVDVDSGAEGAAVDDGAVVVWLNAWPTSSNRARTLEYRALVIMITIKTR
jgi:hypothetical protein